MGATVLVRMPVSQLVTGLELMQMQENIHGVNFAILSVNFAWRKLDAPRRHDASNLQQPWLLPVREDPHPLEILFPEPEKCGCAGCPAG